MMKKESEKDNARRAGNIFPVRKSYDTAKGKWRKHPAVPKGTSWQDYRATATELEHAANLGAVIPAGVVVLDLDTHKGVSKESVESLLMCALDWDAAFIQKTVSGGEHYAFLLPPGVEVKQGDSLGGVTGFDTRAAGKGWICTGEGYEDQTLVGMPEALYVEDFPMLPVEACAVINAGNITAGSDSADFSALDDALSGPLDGIDLTTAERYVMSLPAGDLKTYDTWLKPGMALYHQFGGSADARELWHKWSKLAGDDYNAAEIDSKWVSFEKGASSGNPCRFDYVIHRCGGRVVERTFRVGELIAEAVDVVTHVDYEKLKRKVAQIPAHELADDARQMIAKALFDGFGKMSGVSQAAIRSALKPAKPKAGAGGAGELVEYEGGGHFDDWVYIEKQCEFANTALHYSIKREAFNAKYDRMPVLRDLDKSASAFALVDCKIPTVVDKMFWPGADRIFEHNGLDYLNEYYKTGVDACSEYSEEGREAVELFLRHLAFYVADPREQQIILDFLTYVYQNPGQRVNWALLMQGTYGSGKSFFAYVMQLLMGHLVSNLDPSAISGRFTGWAHGSVLVAVEEIRISGTNKYEVLDRMKPFITNATVQIEEKGKDHRTVPNFSSYMLLTNHKDAIPLTAGDRRYCVIYGRIQSEQQLYKELGGKEGAESYFERLFNTVESNADALAKFFSERVISEDFKPKGRAPETGAKRKMTELAISPDRGAIEDFISLCECAVINNQIFDVTYANKLAEAEGLELPKTRAMAHVLLELGYEQIGGRRVKITHDRSNHAVWYNPELISEGRAKDDVRDFFGGEGEDYIPF